VQLQIGHYAFEVFHFSTFYGESQLYAFYFPDGLDQGSLVFRFERAFGEQEIIRLTVSGDQFGGVVAVTDQVKVEPAVAFIIREERKFGQGPFFFLVNGKIVEPCKGKGSGEVNVVGQPVILQLAADTYYPQIRVGQGFADQFLSGHGSGFMQR
jgi:hypothetical protein